MVDECRCLNEKKGKSLLLFKVKERVNKDIEESKEEMMEKIDKKIDEIKEDI